MAMIAVSVPYHNNPEQAAEQLYNYDHFFGDQHIHIVHISKVSPTSFKNNLEKLIKPLLDLQRVVINPVQLETNPKSIIAQHIENYYFLKKELKFDFEKFIIHSSGDLLVEGNFLEYISTVNCAFNCEPRPVKPTSQWGWAKTCLADDNFIALVKSCGLDINSEIRKGRCEGAILSPEFVEYTFSKISDFYDIRSFAKSKSGWPIEEVIFATLGKEKLGKEKKLIYTKDGGKSKIKDKINYQNIEEYRSKIKHPFGLKWFNPDINDPARKYLKVIQGIAQESDYNLRVFQVEDLIDRDTLESLGLDAELSQPDNDELIDCNQSPIVCSGKVITRNLNDDVVILVKHNKHHIEINAAINKGYESQKDGTENQGDSLSLSQHFSLKIEDVHYPIELSIRVNKKEYPWKRIHLLKISKQ